MFPRHPLLSSEFQAHHIHNSLPAQERGTIIWCASYCTELYLWQGSRSGRWDELRELLFPLKIRPVREMNIVPDDVVGELEERWYYRKHQIELLELECVSYSGSAGEKARTVVEKLGDVVG